MAEGPSNTAPAVTDARAWSGILAPYREPSDLRSIVELVVTIIPLVLFWALAWACLSVSYLLSFGFIVLAAGFLVRLFTLQHDCGHGSFFRARRANDWVGRVIGVFTLTPYEVWRRDHAIHHAGAGNLEKRGTGDIDTLTVSEYLARSPFRRLQYRIYRNPLMLFVVAPAFQFFVRHRWPLGRFRIRRAPWISAMMTNVAIAVFAGVGIWLFGLVPFLLVHIPITLIASSIGVWLFYVQHQFEETTWSDGSSWDLHEAALHGSSHYALPGVLRWLTANIGAHHIHHLCSRIPSYRLPEVLRDHPKLDAYGRITFLESLKCVRLSLWDEQKARLVSFKEALTQSKLQHA